MMTELDFEDDEHACKFLEERGYTQLRGFNWRRPSPDHVPTDEENQALNYLFHEWDWGGVEGIDYQP